MNKDKARLKSQRMPTKTYVDKCLQHGTSKFFPNVYMLSPSFWSRIPCWEGHWSYCGRAARRLFQPYDGGASTFLADDVGKTLPCLPSPSHQHSYRWYICYIYIYMYTYHSQSWVMAHCITRKRFAISRCRSYTVSHVKESGNIYFTLLEGNNVDGYSKSIKNGSPSDISGLILNLWTYLFNWMQKDQGLQCQSSKGLTNIRKWLWTSSWPWLIFYCYVEFHQMKLPDNSTTYWRWMSISD